MHLFLGWWVNAVISERSGKINEENEILGLGRGERGVNTQNKLRRPRESLRRPGLMWLMLQFTLLPLGGAAPNGPGELFLLEVLL